MGAERWVRPSFGLFCSGLGGNGHCYVVGVRMGRDGRGRTVCGYSRSKSWAVSSASESNLTHLVHRPAMIRSGLPHLMKWRWLLHLLIHRARHQPGRWWDRRRASRIWTWLYENSWDSSRIYMVSEREGRKDGTHDSGRSADKMNV